MLHKKLGLPFKAHEPYLKTVFMLLPKVFIRSNLVCPFDNKQKIELLSFDLGDIERPTNPCTIVKFVLMYGYNLTILKVDINLTKAIVLIEQQCTLNQHIHTMNDHAHT